MIKYILIAVAIILTTTTIANAGVLSPSSSTVTPQGYTLDDIYNMLSSGIRATAHTISPVSTSVTPTLHSLTDIYNKIPPPFVLSTTTTAIPAGINRNYTNLATIETDLTSENIRGGVTIFGITGTYSVTGMSSLIWQNDPNLKLCNTSQIVGTCVVGNGYTAEGYGAVEYCQNLNTQGYSDWRLPTLFELINAGPGGYTPQPNFYPDSTYWASTTIDHANYYFSSAFMYSSIGTVLPNTTADVGKRLNVRCVR